HEAFAPLSWTCTSPRVFSSTDRSPPELDTLSLHDALPISVALAPDNAEFLRDLGTVLAMEKKLDESTSYFQRALKIDPRNSMARDRKSTRLNSSHRTISYAVFCLKKKKKKTTGTNM